MDEAKEEFTDYLDKIQKEIERTTPADVDIWETKLIKPMINVTVQTQEYEPGVFDLVSTTDD